VENPGKDGYYKDSVISFDGVDWRAAESGLGPLELAPLNPAGRALGFRIPQGRSSVTKVTAFANLALVISGDRDAVPEFSELRDSGGNRRERRMNGRNQSR
jgi:hypothetical protein